MPHMSVLGYGLIHLARWGIGESNMGFARWLQCMEGFALSACKPNAGRIYIYIFYIYACIAS